jgi:tRNA-specific 2-thiouridylase
MPKTETRHHARRFGLTVSEKPDSQDICFVPNGSYASVVAKLRPQACEPGTIVDLKGTVLGTHKGIIHFTIGQRKGLGISAPDPLYVVQLIPETNEVVVGPYGALAKQSIQLKDVNWLAPGFELGMACCHVKIRSTHAPLAAIVQKVGHDQATVTFQEPEYGVSAGQACVFFQNDHVLGGGWICG